MSEKRNQLKRRIAPGFWEDQEGALHVSIPELCKVAGLEFNEENRKKIVEMLMQEVGSHSQSVLYRASKDDPGTKLK